MKHDKAIEVAATALAYRDSSVVVRWQHKAMAECVINALTAAGIDAVESPEAGVNQT